MIGAPEPNKLLDSQQSLRFMALERRNGIVPDKRHDKKFALLALGIIAAVPAGLGLMLLLLWLFQ